MKKLFCFLASVLPLLFLMNCKTLGDGPNRFDIAGTYHTVEKGDTLAKISSRYHVRVDEIKDINGIDDERTLRVGQALYLPQPDPIGMRIAKLKPKAPPKKAPTPAKKIPTPVRATATKKIMDFPVPTGAIVYRFSRSKENPYDGIGIKAALGTKIISADDGRVLFVGDDGTKFGLIVIVEHNDPFITVYTHLQRALVKTGTIVKRGELLGTVGKSGGASFPHLHFQVRIDQRPQDPLRYVRSP